MNQCINYELFKKLIDYLAIYYRELEVDDDILPLFFLLDKGFRYHRAPWQETMESDVYIEDEYNGMIP